jgi:hypothetical protein
MFKQKAKWRERDVGDFKEIRIILQRNNEYSTCKNEKMNNSSLKDLSSLPVAVFTRKI